MTKVRRILAQQRPVALADVLKNQSGLVVCSNTCGRGSNRGSKSAYLRHIAGNVCFTGESPNWPTYTLKLSCELDYNHN